MTEEKKKLSEIIQEQIAEISKRLDKIQESNLSHANSLTTSTHKDVDELLSCPDCKKKVLEKLRPELETEIEKQTTEKIIKKSREDRLKMEKPKLCEDCGEILDGNKEPDCPTCHGHKY